LRVGLVALLAVLTVRLGAEAVRFGTKSVQQDFASYYVAGQAVSRGLSPFDNHVDGDPPLWDGVSVFRHSRFLYPPIVAQAFVPLTWLSFFAAKFVWMAMALLALAVALWLAARAVGLRLDRSSGLGLAVVATAYFPVLSLLERGQIDSITLAILMVAILLLVRERHPLLAGVLLAVTAACKLQSLFLVPFLVARRRWRALLGFAAGTAGVLVLSLAVHGPGPLGRYLTEELPRISRHGDRGPSESRLAPTRFRSWLAGVPPGHTVVQGRTYAISALSFEINATAVRTPVGRAVWKAARAVGVPLAPAHVSLVFLAVGAAVVLVWQKWNGPPRDRVGEFAYWNVVLTLVLLCAPLTWSMGTVWLLPVTVVVLAGHRGGRPRSDVLPLLLCGAGLVAAGLPDAVLDTLPSVARWKYIGAELLCLVGLLGVWRVRGARAERQGR
jgi:hypothetical protein